MPGPPEPGILDCAIDSGMRIKAIVSCGLEVGSIVKGHEHNVPDVLGAELVRIGYAVEVKPAPATPHTPPSATSPTTKPETKAVKHADK
jgi:hypothetical protein